MRVHLRGVVIGVGVLLSIVVIVSVFNAFDSPAAGGKRARSRHALSMDDDDDDVNDEGSSPSRSSPRSSTRLRGPASRGFSGGLSGPGGARSGGLSGPGGPRAGGPGGRAGGPGGRMGGPGARAGGPGARAGGPGPRAGGPRAGGRVGGPGPRGGPRAPLDDDDDEDDMDLDEMETPFEEVEEEGPRPRGRAGGAAAGRMGARAGGAGGATGARARGRVLDDDDEELMSGGVSGRKAPAKKKAPKKAPKAKQDSEERKPRKKEPPYPEWWKTAFQKSAVAGLEDEVVGDKPLFPECPQFDVGNTLAKVKRFGYVDPPNFMRNSKNPCWFEFNGKKDILKCVPYFYIAGVPKGGTSDLFNRVVGHPNVKKGGAVGYYWWDRLRYGATKSLKYTKEAKRTADPVPLKDYAKFVVGNYGKNVTKEILYLGRSESIFGDASPTYFVENTQWDVFEGNEGCSEPRVIPANFIYHMYPEARIILILRDPIERLYSRFLANVPFVEEYINHTASLFHTFSVQAVQNYRDCFSKTSIRHCAYNASLYSNAVIRLSEGMYSVFLEDWFRIFPKEQILIMKYEDYVQDLVGHIRKVFNHLGLDPIDEYDMLKLSELPIIRKGKEREDEGYLMPETIALLNDFYSPFNLRLADILDDDKWQYKRDESELTAPRPRNVDTEEEGNNNIGPPKEEKEEEEDEDEDEDDEEEEEEEEEEGESEEKPASGGASSGGASGTAPREPSSGAASGGFSRGGGEDANVERMDMVEEDI